MHSYLIFITLLGSDVPNNIGVPHMESNIEVDLEKSEKP